MGEFKFQITGMGHMAKPYSGIVLLLLILLLAGISPAGAASPKRILCTTFPVHQFTMMVAGHSRGVIVERLFPANLGCPHDYALVPGDLRRLAAADALVINGLGLDDFLRPALERLGHGPLEINASEGLLASIESTCTDHHHEENHPHADPHLFASPRRAADMINNIANALSRLDPDNRDSYQLNANKAHQRMMQLADGFSRLGRSTRNPKIVVCHTAFNQLAADSGLEIVALLQDEPGHDPSASEMLRLIQTIRTQKPAAIFSEPQYSSRIAETISRETSIPHATLDPVANGPEDAGADYYFQRMQTNLETLRQRLPGVNADEPGR